ncbi:apolipo protein O-domain-containing protein [Pseudomassariella vexata]|uniref:MICOS complex subunit n=1 Tax=Pseudomassariella vexata TaxID=1141098 RepID=A0A1Y2E4U9_9PEZI|nr:apolipo protein O-domain-containing protein [Pseudomassariella vexata]ORY65885.1 apolipo protein O-domain-containing protein [Pseudomassariella vexata]
MAARLLLRRRAVTPFMAATLVGAALIPSNAYAEAPEDLSKKPIYDDYEAPLPKPTTPAPSPFSGTIPTTESPNQKRGPTPTDRLAVQIGKARMFLYQQATAAEDAVNSTMDKAFDLEKSFTQTVASLAPPRESGEKLMPGLVYVLVAGMAGSIVTRNRNIFLRASVPLALGIGAGWLVIPVTMNNISSLAWRYEQKFPAVAEAHIKTRESFQRGWQIAKARSGMSKQYVDEKVTEARDVVENWVKKGK